MINDKRLAIVILLVWVSLIFYLYPLPQQTDIPNIVSNIQEKVMTDNSWILEEIEGTSDDINEQVVYQELKKSWIFNTVIIIIGIFTAVLGFCGFKYWRIVAIFPIIYYLIDWYFTGSTNTVSIANAISLKWEMAKTLNNEIIFFHKDIIIPLMFVLIAIWAIYSHIKFYKKAGLGP